MHANSRKTASISPHSRRSLFHSFHNSGAIQGRIAGARSQVTPGAVGRLQHGDRPHEHEFESGRDARGDGAGAGHDRHGAAIGRRAVRRPSWQGGPVEADGDGVGVAAAAAQQHVAYEHRRTPDVRDTQGATRCTRGRPAREADGAGRAECAAQRHGGRVGRVEGEATGV